MEDIELKKNEAIIGTIKQKKNRLIVWSITSIIVLGLMIFYLVYSLSLESWSVFNILLVILIGLLGFYLLFKIINLIKKYKISKYIITNQGIYAINISYLKKNNKYIEYSKILDIIIRYNEVMKVYDVEIFGKKKIVGMNDSSSKELVTILESISKDDYQFVIKAIEKYRK